MNFSERVLLRQELSCVELVGQLPGATNQSPERFDKFGIPQKGIVEVGQYERFDWGLTRSLLSTIVAELAI